MKLESPTTVLADMTRRMNARFGQWLLQAAGAREETSAGESEAELSAWPMRVTLASFTEREVSTQMDAVTQWAGQWHKAELELPAGMTLVWETRRWARLGEQRFPAKLVIDSPDALAVWVNQGPRWRQACSRWDALVRGFPNLACSSVCQRHLAVFTDWAQQDVERLHALLVWFRANPRSELYLRQLPVPGIDTKWVEPRKAVVRDFLLATKGQPLTSAAQDFHEVCGLRKPSAKLRLRILCPELRAGLGGLCDVEAPVEEVARMGLSVRSVIIVENLETGLALPDFEGTVAFMRLGHAVSELARIPWLGPDQQGYAVEQRQLPQLVYWGDLDTHGFAILSRARGIFSRLQSVLMDEMTFLGGKSLWVTEIAPYRAHELLHLTPAEKGIYAALRANEWGTNLRLEQERLSWPSCLMALQNALMGAPSGTLADAHRQPVIKLQLDGSTSIPVTSRTQG